MNLSAIKSPELRATMLAAYQAWKATQQQLELFDGDNP